MMSTKVTSITNSVKTQVTGKQHVDTYLMKGMNAVSKIINAE